MEAQTLTSSLGQMLGLSEPDLIQKGMIALIQKELRLAEMEIATLREKYDVFSPEELQQAIQQNRVSGHPAWEDSIVWKNKLTHITQLRQMLTE